MLSGGALANVLAFTGSSYLFSRLSKDNIDAERKRHDKAIEQLQKGQIEWVINDNKESTLSTDNTGWNEQQKPDPRN